MPRKDDKTAQVVAALLERIRSGELAPGEHLREQRIAEQLGVSRAPVRQAFRQLADRRHIRLEAGRGAFVASLSDEEVLDVVYLGSALFGLAARLAAMRADAASQLRLLKLARKISPAAGALSRSQLETARLCASIVIAAARSPSLASMLESLRHTAIEEFVPSVFQSGQSAAQYASDWLDLAIAIKMRDAERAEQKARGLPQYVAREAFRAGFGLVREG